MNEIRFTFSDMIAGYVTNFNHKTDTFKMKTTDGREFQVALTSTTNAELLRNLDEAYADSTAQMHDMLCEGRYLFVYGIFYPEAKGYKIEAKRLVFLGRSETEYSFEKPDWWIKQVRSLGNFYLKAQFADGSIDYRNYRTKISLSGIKTGDLRQETDTISRLVYGFATAYLLTGEDQFLEAAEKGTDYLREHMRFVDKSEGIVYWYHGIDVQGTSERKIFASEFGDDYDAIPMYEQIYALAGPTQTYRITGDPRILSDIEMTVKLFDRFFIDREQGGYFSHIDPISLDPRSAALGHNRARKNWNSVGDHAPAYLINVWLATGEEKYADFLVETADTIMQQFPDWKSSPFVQERFHEDWSHDPEWGWQQNRAVIGHNLKIAWNLMRIHHVRPHPEYVELAQKIAQAMPTVGSDQQRGGWYDVVERVRGKGEERHRLVWHDRKAWWQQEQAILAYLILAGSLNDQESLRLARESSAFYNAWFLDHDDGAVYFNVLANGLPYLLGNERLKGSHSMANYHSSELCYLAATYTNLLITKEPLDLYFKPKPGGFKDNILRVQPDILPLGSVRISEVWINDEKYADFDSGEMTVKLPPSKEDLRVQVRVVPALDVFHVSTEMNNGIAKLILSGKLEDNMVPAFMSEVEKALSHRPKRLVVMMQDLQYISNAGLRVLIYTRQKMGIEDTADIYVVGSRGQVKEVCQGASVQDILVLDEYDAALIEA